MDNENLAVLRSHSCVSVHMVLQRRNGLEHTRADGALVWSLLGVSLQMSCQQVALGTGVVAVATHQVRSATEP